MPHIGQSHLSISGELVNPLKKRGIQPHRGELEETRDNLRSQVEEGGKKHTINGLWNINRYTAKAVCKIMVNDKVIDVLQSVSLVMAINQRWCTALHSPGPISVQAHCSCNLCIHKLGTDFRVVT